MTLIEVLDWLTSADGGAFVLVLWLTSWGFEKVAWWHALASKTRGLVIAGASVAVAIGAQWLKGSPETVAAIQPYFQPAMYAVLAWLATQVAHAADPFKPKG